MKVFWYIPAPSVPAPGLYVTSGCSVIDYDTVPKFAIAISVVAVIVAAAALVTVALDDQPDDRYRI